MGLIYLATTSNLGITKGTQHPTTEPKMHKQQSLHKMYPHAHRQWLLSARPHSSTKSGSVFDFLQPPTTGTQTPHLAPKK